jgi:hypothetical protein
VYPFEKFGAKVGDVKSVLLEAGREQYGTEEFRSRLLPGTTFGKENRAED